VRELYEKALGGDGVAVLILSDLYMEYFYMNDGTPVYIDGPLDITIGIIESYDGLTIRMAPGAVTSRYVTDATKTIATGKPTSGTEYVVHPRGRNVLLLATTGWSELPKFDPKDWPAGGIG
jgi:hypothetical protein